MLIAELVNSCTHEPVARAAVLSLGSRFLTRVERAARNRGQTTGAYAARRVMRFAERASDTDWRSLARAMEGADMPVLDGLRFILERDLDRHESADDEKDVDGPTLDRLCREVALRKTPSWM
jgi:hypothetical protein